MVFLNHTAQLYNNVNTFVFSPLPLQSKRDEHMLKRRNVPAAPDSTDSDESEKPSQQSLETIVQNAYSTDAAVQLSAVQSAR